MKSSRLKWIAAVALVAIVVGLIASGVGQSLTLDNLRDHRDWLVRCRNEQPLRAAAMYFLAYVTFSGLAIPGAGMLSLVGGLMFGLGWGTVLASLGSSTGATVSCLMARYFFRDWIQTRFKENLTDVNVGFRRDGTFYLLSLRLIPLFPYFMVNLVMGVLPIGIFRFFVVSLVGMLPSTFLYVNAGTQLNRIQSFADIFSWPILISFAILGFIPMIGQWIFASLKASPRAR